MREAALGAPLTLRQASTEEALVLEARQGDSDAFAQLYETHVKSVYGYLYARLRSEADAEDVAAEVFIKAMRGLPSFKPGAAPFGAWLIRIAHNEMVNLVKKRARRREVPLGTHDVVSDDPVDQALGAVAADEVRNAISGLTELQRQVLSLRFGSELSIGETAEAMRRSIQAVKFLQHSALKALRRAMRRVEA